MKHEEYKDAFWKEVKFLNIDNKNKVTILSKVHLQGTNLGIKLHVLNILYVIGTLLRI